LLVRHEAEIEQVRAAAHASSLARVRIHLRIYALRSAPISGAERVDRAGPPEIRTGEDVHDELATACARTDRRLAAGRGFSRGRTCGRCSERSRSVRVCDN